MKTYLHILTYLILFSLGSVSAQDAAWDAIKTYQYGDDFKPLLLVEQAVEASTASPEEKAKTAARLASLLTDETSYPGRQFVCMQLRLVGGAAEVAKLAEYLDRPTDAENARMALADIPCEEALVPLRKALETFEGKPLVGVIRSLAARGDTTSIPVFTKLLDSEDKTVASAAAAALGRLGADGVIPLKVKFTANPNPVLGTALIDAANEMVSRNQKSEAKEIFVLLSFSQSKAVRRAALEGYLRIMDDSERKSTISQWFFEKDAEKNIIAAARLKELSPEQFDELFKKIDSVSPQSRVVLLEIAAQRNSSALLETLHKSAKSSDTTEKVTALRTLGHLRDASAIPILFKALGEKGEIQNAAQEALARFDAATVGPKLVEALSDTKMRNPAIDVIVAMKYYDAIDPMLKLAQQDNEAVVEGLGRLCDPDEHDLPRLLDLYLRSRPGRHRDRVERAVVVVCEKHDDAKVRANLLLDILAKRSGGLSDDVLETTLPLLGKVGNARVAELLFPLIENGKPKLKLAAVRALCNWPNSDYLNELWNIATKNTNNEYRQWALRAYIRVATLKSDRSESETLEMLKKAMQIARSNADKQFCLSRCSAVRTLDSVEWAASFLDDAVLSQTACLAIVELAHHRFLREPNKAKFEPILLQVEKTAKDKDVAQRAQKSRLGM